MILYDDLINAPYKAHGRTLEGGFDCYGLVLECCKRAGTPLRDVYYERDTIPTGELAQYIEQGVNVEPIDHAEPGAVIQMEYGGRLHIGYMVARDLVIHATINKGVKVSHIGLVNMVQCYRVIN